MPDVTFINYRREDSASEAKLIANEIADLISSDAVFMDSTTINYGDQWPDRIQAALLDSKYVFTKPDTGQIQMDGTIHTPVATT